MKLPEQALEPGARYVCVVEIDDHGSKYEHRIAAESFSITRSGTLVVGDRHVGEDIAAPQAAFNKSCWAAAWVGRV